MASVQTETTEGKGPRIQSVSRALAILTVIALSPTGVSAKELSETLKISRPTIYHLLRTLMDDAFISRGPDRRYRLGMRIGTLAEAFSRQLTPDEELLTLLRRLAEETGEASYVVARRGLEIVLLAVSQGTHYVSVTLPSLGLLPDAHARASGKVALAFASADTQTQYIKTHLLERITENTTSDATTLMAELEEVRERGYALNLEELHPGLCAMAAPVDGGTSPFVLALSAPSDRFHENFDMYLEVLLHMAREGSTKAREVRGSRIPAANQSSDGQN